MTSSLRAWFETRPTWAPSSPIPPRPANVLAVVQATDGTAEIRIVQKADGRLSFELVAWTNFEDAGGDPHHTWHIFPPELALITDSFDTALDAALVDARARKLSVGPVTRLVHEQEQ
jgi:hypothetical protein